MAKTTNPFDKTNYANNEHAKALLDNIMKVTTSEAIILGTKVGIDIIPPYNEDDSSEYFKWKADTEAKLLENNCLISIVRAEYADSYQGSDSV